MITWSSFQCILIIFQELHDEPLKRKVNDVNQITIERKTFVRRSITIIKVLFVLGERKHLSFKTLSAYPWINHANFPNTWNSLAWRMCWNPSFTKNTGVNLRHFLHLAVDFLVGFLGRLSCLTACLELHWTNRPFSHDHEVVLEFLLLVFVLSSSTGKQRFTFKQHTGILLNG